MSLRVPPGAGRGAGLLAICQGSAGGAVRAASGESETHVAGVQVPHARTIVAEMRMYAVGIQQTTEKQLEHGGLAGWWEATRREISGK